MKVEFDNAGRVASAKFTSIDLSQKASDVVLERTNIQRASDVIFIQQDGKDYAIVADDNLDNLDPYWKAMFAVPDFVNLSPGAPPHPSAAPPTPRRCWWAASLASLKTPLARTARRSTWGKQERGRSLISS